MSTLLHTAGLDHRIAAWTLNVTSLSPGLFAAPQDMHRRITAVDKLPPLPETARRLMALKTDPYLDARKLSEVIDLDPGLASQVMRWASSAFFGFPGKLRSIRDAIVRLGLEQVMHLSLGVAALSAMRVPADGPLGRRVFWRQTIAGAWLLRELMQTVETEYRSDPETTQLAYLLHNLGHLLLAHLFTAEFNWISRLIVCNTDLPINKLERYALGTDHAEIGAWLLAAWMLPAEAEAAARHHHNPNYVGPHQHLVRLCGLTDALLGEANIGDVSEHDRTLNRWMESLQLTEPDRNRLAAALRERIPAIDEAVESLLAVA